jgi:hypothetical protein
MLKGVKRGAVAPLLQGLGALEPRFSLPFTGVAGKQKALAVEGLSPVFG